MEYRKCRALQLLFEMFLVFGKYLSKSKRKKIVSIARFQVLTVVKIQVEVFWVVT
jgi:5-methylcytosine-specific restriction endonuclease McrBC regulatory subunit McrC